MEASAETIMPSQWLDLHASDNGEASPLRRLYLAVLADAVRCVTGHAYSESSGKHRRRHRAISEKECREWLRSDSDAPFGFLTTCAVLGIDPAWMRAGLREWLARRGQLEGMRRSPVHQEQERRIVANRPRHDRPRRVAR
jgi:hypothetical protein